MLHGIPHWPKSLKRHEGHTQIPPGPDPGKFPLRIPLPLLTPKYEFVIYLDAFPTI